MECAAPKRWSKFTTLLLWLWDLDTPSFAKVCVSIFHPKADAPFSHLHTFFYHPTGKPLSCLQKWTVRIVTSQCSHFAGGLSIKKAYVCYFHLGYVTSLMNVKKLEYLRSIVSSTSQERRSRARVPSCRMQFTFFKCNIKFYKECNDAIHHFVVQNVISEDFLMTPHKDEEGLVRLRPKWRQAQVRYREKLERAQICMTSFLNSGTLIFKH